MLSDAATLQALSEADAELARGEEENQDSLAAAMRARRASYFDLKKSRRGGQFEGR